MLCARQWIAVLSIAAMYAILQAESFSGTIALVLIVNTAEETSRRVRVK